MKSMAIASFVTLMIALINKIEGSCDTVRCMENRICKIVNSKAVCVCRDDSTAECSPLKCQTSKDCQDNEYCLESKCRKVCDGVCGKNADCKPLNHTPICNCAENYVGDPFVACHSISEEGQQDNGKCDDDNDCVDRQMCIKNQCTDPCLKENVCGKRAQCAVKSHVVHCFCPFEYIGNPYVECVYLNKDVILPP